MNNARDISYSSVAQTQAGRAVIRILENATGRKQLINRARGYCDGLAEGENFWNAMAECYGLRLEIVGRLETIPTDGPLIITANHPYGILDGLVMGKILNETRSDFRILANTVFGNGADLGQSILPINFAETKAALQENLATRKAALSFLSDGGALAVFPGGTVSTSATPFGPPLDPAWRTFTAKLIAKSGAIVVPVYFNGANSRLFQLASHAHPTLRVGLLIREFKRLIRKPVRLTIGDPIDRSALAERGHDPKAMMDFLRQSTYELSQSHCGHVPYGYEFEKKYRRAQHGGRNF